MYLNCYKSLGHLTCIIIKLETQIIHTMIKLGTQLGSMHYYKTWDSTIIYYDKTEESTSIIIIIKLGTQLAYIIIKLGTQLTHIMIKLGNQLA